MESLFGRSGRRCCNDDVACIRVGVAARSKVLLSHGCCVDDGVAGAVGPCDWLVGPAGELARCSVAPFSGGGRCGWVGCVGRVVVVAVVVAVVVVVVATGGGGVLWLLLLLLL